MEQTEEYKNVTAKIKVLEEQLALCSVANDECESSEKSAKKEIEDSFSSLLNALASRKESLLKEVAQKVDEQKQRISETQVLLTSSIDACKQSLKSTAMVYVIDKNSAYQILKGLMGMSVPQVVRLQIVTKTPVTLLDSIKNYGEVIDSPLFSATISKQFSKAELVSTFAGSAEGNIDGKGQNAQISTPWGICWNPNDECFYLCCSGSNAIKKLTLQGDVTTFVTGGLSQPIGIAVNYKENTLFVVNNGGHSIIKVTSLGKVNTFVGSGKIGKEDGFGADASFNYPIGITVHQQTGNIFIGDQGNHLVRKITPKGVVSTLAGSGQGFTDGNGKNAKFNAPWGMCFDADSALLICDRNNNKLRRLNLNGDVSTLCEIPQPAFVTLTENRTILVSSCSHKLYIVTHHGSQNYKVEVLAGSGIPGKMDGKPEECSFNSLKGIAVHEPSHSCFVTEIRNHLIRKVSFVNLN